MRAAIRSACPRAMLLALVLAACARAPSFREVRIQPSSGAPSVRGDGAEISSETLAHARAERVVIEGAASTPWWQARQALVAVTEMGATSSVTLEEGARRLAVHLPRGAPATRGDAWVVDVGAGGALRFGTESTRLEALEEVAREPAGAPSTWFLVRGDDSATFGDVMTALATLERLAPRRVVLGALTAAMTQAETWSCPSPGGKEHEEATATFLLDVRDDGHVGSAHLVAATAPEFAVAAVFCIARQRVAGHAGKRAYQVRVHFSGEADAKR